MGEDIALIVGLGNPGAAYKHTRHNIGFEVIDAYLKKLELTPSLNKKFKAELVETRLNNRKVIFAKPQTYMNVSGDAVLKLMQFYKIPSEKLLVIHDDVSLDTGKLRVQCNRGAGGQHGVEDIMLKLGGNKNFTRIKFGVGPDPGGAERGDYVLSVFPKEAAEIVNLAINESIKLIDTWLD